MNKEHFVFSCRRFLISGVAAATTTQLQHAPSALGLAAESGACKLAAEQEVGPYYVAEELLRSDISEGEAWSASFASRCAARCAYLKALPNAAVDLWHCELLVSTPALRSRTPWVRVVPVVSAARHRVVHGLKVHRQASILNNPGEWDVRRKTTLPIHLPFSGEFSSPGRTER